MNFTKLNDFIKQDSYPADWCNYLVFYFLHKIRIKFTQGGSTVNINYKAEIMFILRNVPKSFCKPSISTMGWITNHSFKMVNSPFLEY